VDQQPSGKWHEWMRAASESASPEEKAIAMG